MSQSKTDWNEILESHLANFEALTWEGAAKSLYRSEVEGPDDPDSFTLCGEDYEVSFSWRWAEHRGGDIRQTLKLYIYSDDEPVVMVRERTIRREMP